MSITRSAAPRTGSRIDRSSLDRLDETVGVLGQRMAGDASRRTGAPARPSTHRGTPRVTSWPVGPQLADLGEHLGVLAAGDERESFDVAVRLRRELDDRADQRRRQVVDDEPPEILEHVGHTRSAGPRQAGDQARCRPPPAPYRPPTDPHPGCASSDRLSVAFAIVTARTRRPSTSRRIDGQSVRRRRR